MTDEAKLLPDEKEDEPLPVYTKSLTGRWSSERSLAQQIAFVIPTAQIERFYQQLTDFLGKASERWSVIRELWREHLRMVDFYMSPSGGKLSLEDAQRITSGEYAFSGDGTEDGKLTLAPKTNSQEETVDKELSYSLSWDVDNLSWYGLDRLFRANPDLAEQVWDEVKEAAARDFKSGHFAAELFERTDWQKNVWKRAHFVAVFQMMVESYKPRDAIEH